MEKQPTGIYPAFSVDHIKTPNRFWATPILGGIIKIIILIPVFFEISVLMIYIYIISIINSLVVLFTGKYWRYCFSVTTGTLKLATKTGLFFVGLTNKYPGFTFKIEDKITLDFKYPKNPSRFFAIPILGGVARIILLIPYSIYTQAISNGAFFGAIVSSFPVFFKGRYPESTYEMGRDATRLGLSEMMYFAGISDSYPSFSISMNHQTIKILLIIVGALMLINQSQTREDANKDINFRYNPDNQYQKNFLPGRDQMKQNNPTGQDKQFY